MVGPNADSPRSAPPTDVAEATDIAFLPATEMAARLARRQIGARELLEHHLDRVACLNPQLNAVIWIEPERGRAARPGHAWQASRDGIAVPPSPVLGR